MKLISGIARCGLLVVAAANVFSSIAVVSPTCHGQEGKVTPPAGNDRAKKDGEKDAAKEKPADDAEVQAGNDDAEENLAGAEDPFAMGGPGNAQSAGRVREWIRGLIQNELDQIDAICSLSNEQKQSLVDVLEKEWRSKSSSIIQAATQPNTMSQVDLESRVEKYFIAWSNSILNENQRQLWADEIKERYSLRRDLVIGKMVAAMETKVGLTATQMDRMTELLTEKWKENWWTLYQSGSLPETKFSWITTILTDAQRTGYADRNASRQEVWTSMQQPVDYPSLAQDVRFSIGDIKSSESIALSVDKSNKKNNEVKAMRMNAIRLMPAIPAPRLAAPEAAEKQDEENKDQGAGKDPKASKDDDKKDGDTKDGVQPKPKPETVPQETAESPDADDPFR